MDQKNLMAQAAGPVNPTTTEELPAPELAQLSEEALQELSTLGPIERGPIERSAEESARIEHLLVSTLGPIESGCKRYFDKEGEEQEKEDEE